MGHISQMFICIKEKLDNFFFQRDIYAHTYSDVF